MRCHLHCLLLFTSVTGLDFVNRSSRIFNIGGVLQSDLTQEHFKKTLRKINFDGESVADSSTLYDVTVILRSNPLTTVNQVCESLIAEGVHAMVVSGPSTGMLPTVTMSYISSFYQIPMICTHSRDSAFSDKNIHVFFLRTVPPYSHQADVWLAILRYFKYRQVVFIHSSDTNGRAIYSRFQSLALPSHGDDGIKLATVIEFNPGVPSFVEELNMVKGQLVKVILLYANVEDSATIFHDASYFNMTGPGYMWLVTEEALRAQYAPVGALGLQLKYANDTFAHVTDSIRIIARGLRQLQEKEVEIGYPPRSCSENCTANCRGSDWVDTGMQLLQQIKQQVIYDGETGKVGFDLSGDRIFAEYSLVSIQGKASFCCLPGRLQVVGDYSYDKKTDEMKLSINISDIVWPGGTKEVPLGYTLPTHFKVLTLREKPFVYADPVDSLDECDLSEEVPCPFFNSTVNETQPMCCYGYCIDLLLTLAAKNNFSFDLELSPDKHYGDFAVNKQGVREWTGIIGQLVNEDQGVDMIAAPLTINPERSNAIEFSKPFKYQGITILVKRVPHETALVSILQPFRDTLWLMLLATVHVIAILVWILDRLSPLYQITGDDSDSLTLSESFWFSWSVILNSGLTEGTPRSLSGRMLGIIWGGFAMIMVASYTANLAAFLVLDNPETTITGINDARLRNPVENFTFATIRGSAVDMFFQRKTEWSNMYRVMEMHNYDSVDDALEALRNGSLQAFIWESSRLEYEASQDCSLVTVGELFGRSGYGFGLKKGSPWSDKITIDILDLHERGYIEELDKFWIWNDDITCSEDLLDEGYSKRLGLKNLEGIFIMVAGGIFTGVILIIGEKTYDICQKKKKKKDGNRSSIKDNGDREQVAAFRVGSEAEDTYRSDAEPKPGDSSTNYGHSSQMPLGKVDEKGIVEEPYSSVNTQTNLLEPGSSCQLLQDIEERLRDSPNIPEEWKNRSPLQWFQYYLEVLRCDAETRSKAENDEAVAIMEGFVDFIREKGISNFSEVYNDSFDGGVAEKENVIQRKLVIPQLLEPDESVEICAAIGDETVAFETEHEELQTHESHQDEARNFIEIDQWKPSYSNVFPKKGSKYSKSRLPDVLFNCNGKETDPNEDVCPYDC